MTDGARPTRLLLEYRGDRVEPRGVILVGRGVECQLRFNDPTVSRRHLRMDAGPAGVTIEDLDSTNGVRINGQRIEGPYAMEAEDTLQIGNREIFVRAAGEADLRGVVTIDPKTCEAQAIPTHQSCLSCGHPVPMDDEVCGECQHRWPPGRPASSTVEIPISTERRRSPRVMVDIPALYVSPLVTCDVNAVNLSRGGVYLLTQIIDEAQMPCQIIFLPDGTHPTALSGVVRHVTAISGNGHGFGMGIEFVEVGDAATRFLASLV